MIKFDWNQLFVSYLKVCSVEVILVIVRVWECVLVLIVIRHHVTRDHWACPIIVRQVLNITIQCITCESIWWVYQLFVNFDVSFLIIVIVDFILLGMEWTFSSTAIVAKDEFVSSSIVRWLKLGLHNFVLFFLISVYFFYFYNGRL